MVDADGPVASRGHVGGNGPAGAHLRPGCTIATLEELAAQPALALLFARTQALSQRFALSSDNAADLATICVRLDGLPLALELAAVRLCLLTPRALLKRLEHRLALLSEGPRDLPERQRSMRAVIAWSYGLLDLRERLLFERLAVFAGSWSLEAGEQFVASLRLFAEQRVERGMLEALIGLGALATAQGRPISWLTPKPWRGRATGDSAAFVAAWQAGRGLSWDAACALAETVGRVGLS